MREFYLREEMGFVADIPKEVQSTTNEEPKKNKDDIENEEVKEDK